MFFNHMKNLGYKEEEIFKITNTYPVNRFRLDNLLVSVKKIYSFFLQFGYADGQIRKIVLERPQILCLEVNSLQNKIDNFKELGFSSNDIIKITLSFPTIYSYGTDSILNKVSEYENLGYQRDILIKGIKRYPEILGISMNNIKNKLDNLVKLGYTHDDVIKMTSKNMGMFNYKIDTIESKLNFLVDIGFSYIDSLYIIRVFPSILNFTTDYVNIKINALEDLGYTHNQVLAIFRKNPSLFGERVEMLQEKKFFYDSVGLFDLFIVDSGQLKQSVELSYARYMYFRELGIEISTKDNSYKQLFLSNRRFLVRYKISKEELIKKYNYDDLEKGKKYGRVI